MTIQPEFRYFVFQSPPRREILSPKAPAFFGEP